MSDTQTKPTTNPPAPLPEPRPRDRRPTVHVACKIPNGLVLQLQTRVEGKDASVGIGDQVAVAGSHQAHLIGGYGVTEIDKEFWEEWLKQNSDYGPVRQGLIFAEPTRERADAKAKEMRHVLTGLEGIPPERLGPGLIAVP